MTVYPSRAPIPNIRHKCFISFHQADEDMVQKFVESFDDYGNSFISRSLRLYREMGDDIIRSTDPDYIMRRIREDYLKDSTVTIVMLGRCTWARRYVDWEIQASLRQGENITPNGLLAIRLPTYIKGDAYPHRLNLNLRPANAPDGTPCYARVIGWPSREQLVRYIDDAYDARSTRASLINNPRDRKENNSDCLR